MQSFIDQISNADTVAAVEQIVADAKLADELALQQAETETQIDEMAYLSDDEKASYKDRVANATTSDEVTTIIDEAEAINLANAKEWAHDEISDLTNLSASLVSSFSSEASDSDTVAEVEEVVPMSNPNRNKQLKVIQFQRVILQQPQIIKRTKQWRLILQ